MELTVHQARWGTPKNTIVMSGRVRERILREYGNRVVPGFAVQVTGPTDRCPRNLIVLKIKRDDPLLRTNGVARIGKQARKRLGLEVGETVSVVPLHWECYYHGTKAADPMVIATKGWIVGPGAGYGAGVYLTTDLAVARAFGQTGIITAAVAWGEQLTWPLPDGPLKQQLLLWCREHDVDPDPLLALPNLQQHDDPHVGYVLRWARLYGHYYEGGSDANRKIRVFPGPIGSGYKANRLRVIRVEKPDGTVLWQRPTTPFQPGTV